PCASGSPPSPAPPVSRPPNAPPPKPRPPTTSHPRPTPPPTQPHPRPTPAPSPRIGRPEAATRPKISHSGELAEQAKRRASAPGVGFVTVAALLAQMPELRRLSPNAPATPAA